MMHGTFVLVQLKHSKLLFISLLTDQIPYSRHRTYCTNPCLFHLHQSASVWLLRCHFYGGYHASHNENSIIYPIHIIKSNQILLP